ncbi:hypothetical protein L218DRAFT_1005517 [Marasmius fiardii PR-910]|nr:hypothetical protein L218DRAFT_1005517 [Marasmius fiardii PR-910]
MSTSIGTKHNMIIGVVIDSGMVYTATQALNVVWMFKHRSSPIMALGTLPDLATAAVRLSSNINWKTGSNPYVLEHGTYRSYGLRSVGEECHREC